MQNPLWMLFLLAVHTCWMMPLAHAQEAAKTIVIDFSRELGPVAPRTGFLGGLRDATPDAVIQPLHRPSGGSATSSAGASPRACRVPSTAWRHLAPPTSW